MNHKNKSQFMTYDKNATIFQSQIVEIMNKNQECSNGKTRNCFKVKHPTKDELLTCVFWERSCMEVGDKVDLKGVFKEGCFVAYSAMVNRYANIQKST
jgi:hypothetical protein